ncbi:MAG: T9SS type A sorting domain-containing protein [Calditrichaeota bacterium]|nr:T9SS type A sorting domain-containing protein [Calditrichota bacterium]
MRSNGLIHKSMFIVFVALNFANCLFAQTKVVGYYPSWMKTTYSAQKIEYNNLTHINHAFAWPDQDGGLYLSGDFLYPQLNELAHQSQVKILVSLGGWGNCGGFSPMVADSGKRAKFIDNLVNFIRSNNYDGADFDWEFPNSVNDRNNFTTLIQELRARFDDESSGWLITIAVGVGDWAGQWFDYNKLKEYVDWFNAMCYDFHGSWSAHAGHNAPLHQPPGDYDGAVDTGMAYLHNTRGIPKSQLTVGMPFYGRQFNASALNGSFSGAVVEYQYSKIIPKINNDWTYHWDDVAKVPYLTNSVHTKLITFDDTTSIRYKCQWIKEQGYSGGMIWALGQDYFGGQQTLLETIGIYLLDSGTSIIQRPEVVASIHLDNNFPNPFNSQTKIGFALNKADHVSLSIYNTVGQRVKQLIDGDMTAGNHFAIWAGDDDFGRKVASGVYIYRMESGNFIGAKKMMLIE